jgi:hypothetical protein
VRILKPAVTAADEMRVTTTFPASDVPAADAAASALRRFTEMELDHALRATASQQLRVVAAARARAGVDTRAIAALEQAIADRIDRIVTERRQAVDRARNPCVPRIVRDELAARRSRRTQPSVGRPHARA